MEILFIFVNLDTFLICPHNTAYNFVNRGTIFTNTHAPKRLVLNAMLDCKVVKV